MISRIRGLITGLIAMTAMIAVVAGLPAVLYQFGGSPLPRHLAGWHHIAGVLTSRDNGSLLLGTVRDGSWLAWLLFTVGVLAEAQAALRGRTAPRLWLCGLQGSAARLVALAALTFTAPSVVSLSASVAATAPVTAGHANGGTTSSILSAALTSHAASPDAVAANRLVTVRAGDCLWTIAQHYLGAGNRYPEIASMNYGRDMGDGQIFTNPSLIEPGWQLLLPAHAGQARDVAAHASVPRDGRAHHQGHTTHGGHFKRQHQAAAQHPATSDLDAPGPVVAANGNSPGRADQRPTGPAPIEHEDLPAVATFGAGALAAAVLMNLARLRRRQRQYRRSGRRIPLPADSDVLAAEQRLRAAGPVTLPTTLQDALSCLESGLTGTAQVLPDIVGLHVTPGLLEVLLASPAMDAPPAPFSITPGREGMCWQLEMPADAGSVGTIAPAGRAGGLLPGLFAAGETDDGFLLLDLESLQVTGCDGPPELIAQVVSAIATELAAGQWSGWYELVLVGFDELGVLGRAEHVASLDEALDLLDARSSALRRRLADQTADVRQLRLAAPADEDWGLTVLVSRAEPTADQMARLLELSEDGPGGIAALVAGDAETSDGRMAPTVLQLAPDPQQTGAIVANVVPLQISVRPQVLSDTEYQAITTLFAAATDLTDVSPEQPPYQIHGAPTRTGDADGAIDTSANGVAAPPWAILEDEQGRTGRHAQRLDLKILGPFVISGAAEPLQPKQAELLLALALAGSGGLTNSALCGMLGADPDHPKPSDAVRQIITRTRRRLGSARDGQEYLIHAGNGSYVLNREVSLDWAEFRNLVATGRADDIRAALALVRGEPFTGSYFWWIDIPLLETVRAEIVDAAETLAEFELATGSTRAAARAARAGLAAEASAEQLWRLLMRAEHAAGNLGGVGEAWRSCLDAIQDIAPGGEPHPDTVALYRQLSFGSREQAPVRL